ncbi:hypothetical protein L1987_36829 [Smallanthus sonchifolius]|uniref:Uncharacterized protein n=1 Tax=Smallanthus sonchifolius TaxID=185202 RepID=A0ACB9HG14_9ASTR|nr:hypothetical protein L1987_36829 [Smallanthus sonchifolius]
MELGKIDKSSIVPMLISQLCAAVISTDAPLFTDFSLSLSKSLSHSRPWARPHRQTYSLPSHLSPVHLSTTSPTDDQGSPVWDALLIRTHQPRTCSSLDTGRCNRIVLTRDRLHEPPIMA